MDDNRKIHIADAEDPADFDLEDILAEYRAVNAPVQEPKASLADRSRRLVMEHMEEGGGAAGFASLDEVIEDACAEEASAAAASAAEEPAPAPTSATEELTDEALEALRLEFEGMELKDGEGEEYASPEAGVFLPEDRKDAERELAFRQKQEKNEKTKERLLSPLVAVMALFALRRSQKQSREEQAAKEADAAAAAQPEPTPEQAIRRFGRVAFSLERRGLAAVLFCLAMLYLSVGAGGGLPLTGALKSSPRAMALTLMILLMTVMMLGLDVLTNGILAVAKGKPGGDSLAAASCLFSLLDGAFTALRNDGSTGVPFCAVSALSLTFCIIGAFYACRARRSTYRVLRSRNLSAVSPEQGGSAPSLVRARRDVSGFISRFEAPDHADGVFGIICPVLIIGSVLLGILCGLTRGTPSAIPHCISVLCAGSAALSVPLCVSLPMASAARRFTASGAAVAGWPGVRDIGRCRSVILTDTDIFPEGTVELGSVRVLENAFPEKVISCTASVLCASGCGLAAPFEELMHRNGYALYRVENFAPHDGGGMSAMVNGESVCVGGSGYMNLIGIRVPRKLCGRDSVFTAVNGALVGIFSVTYKTLPGVKSALASLLRSNVEPVFALRDFNITPVMIADCFGLDTDSIRFPAYTERFRISAPPDAAVPVAAVLARDGLVPFAEAAERGRRLYTGIRIGTAISAVSCVLGLLLMFLLCWTGAFDTASVGKVTCFLLLWLLPPPLSFWASGDDSSNCTKGLLKIQVAKMF